MKGYRTVGINALIGILAALDLSGLVPILSGVLGSLFGAASTPETTGAVVAGIMALVNIGMRWITSGPIFNKPT